jgi:hypothetical protein
MPSRACWVGVTTTTFSTSLIQPSAESRSANPSVWTVTCFIVKCPSRIPLVPPPVNSVCPRPGHRLLAYLRACGKGDRYQARARSQRNQRSAAERGARGTPVLPG